MTFLKKIKVFFQKESDQPSSQSVAGDHGAGFAVLQKELKSGGRGIWRVHPDVQREIEKGTHLNMKAVIRGMRGTGKSTIVSRLCGFAVSKKYTPSPEISAGTIFYRSRIGDVTGGCVGRGAKVELWDVVDEGFTTAARLKTATPQVRGTTTTTAAVVADVRSVDIYKNCHIAAFVIDRTRKETLDYAVREAHHVPPTVCLLFILNFNDTPRDAHVVTTADVDTACKNLRRATTPMILAASAGRLPPDDYSIAATWVDVSAATGHGMVSLLNAFEVPYIFLSLLYMETRIYSHFRFIEQYQSWLAIETAKSCTLEDNGQVEQTQLDHTVASQSIIDSAMPLVRAFVARDSQDKELKSLNMEEDENGIAKNFFDDFDEYDTGAENVVKKGSEHSNNSVSGNNSDNGGTSGNSNSNKNNNNNVVMHVDSFACVSLQSPQPPTPLFVAQPAPRFSSGTAINFLLDDDNAAFTNKLNREFPSEILNVVEDQKLDDAFFSSSSSENGAPLDNSVLNVEVGDTDVDDLFTNTEAQISAVAVASAAGPVRGEDAIVTETASIHADVNFLVQQMQSVLGVYANVKKKGLHVNRGESKSQNHHHRGGRKRKHGKIYAWSDAVKSTLVTDCNSYEDDGGFEVIKE